MVRDWFVNQLIERVESSALITSERVDRLLPIPQGDEVPPVRT
jgi:hypothetical protein